MRDELERVRDWAKGQIRIGSKAPASWDQYVTLIESADAIPHEIAVVANLPESISITCPGADEGLPYLLDEPEVQMEGDRVTAAPASLRATGSPRKGGTLREVMGSSEY